MRARQGTGRSTASAVTLAFTCEWCGRRVELAATEVGVEIKDPGAFLALHRECLRQRPPAE